MRHLLSTCCWEAIKCEYIYRMYEIIVYSTPAKKVSVHTPFSVHTRNFGILWNLQMMKVLGQPILFIIWRFSLLRGCKI